MISIHLASAKLQKQASNRELWCQIGAKFPDPKSKLAGIASQSFGSRIGHDHLRMENKEAHEEARTASD